MRRFKLRPSHFPASALPLSHFLTPEHHFVEYGYNLGRELDIIYSSIVYLLTSKLPGKQNMNSSFHNHSFIHSGSETLNRLGVVVQTTSALWRQFRSQPGLQSEFLNHQSCIEKTWSWKKGGKERRKGGKVIVSNHPFPHSRWVLSGWFWKRHWLFSYFLLTFFPEEKHLQNLFSGLSGAQLHTRTSRGDSMFPLCSILPHSPRAFSSVLCAVSVTICQL